MTDGERWARELLAELGSARYRPRAWLRFLARSFARAAERRRERRREHRQALVLGVAGLCAWGAVAAAGRPALALAGIGWWSLVVLMLDWHLGMLERRDGSPLGGLGPGNVLSLLRIGLVPALPALSPALLAAALLTAGVVDVVDGRLARARNEVSRLGFWLDGAGDSFVLGVGALAAAQAGLLPAWVAALVVARYVVLWAALALAYFVRSEALAGDGVVSGRVPGSVLVTGLALAALDLPGGTALVAVGAAGALATLAATIVRARRRAAAGAIEAAR